MPKLGPRVLVLLVTAVCVVVVVAVVGIVPVVVAVVTGVSPFFRSFDSPDSADDFPFSVPTVDSEPGRKLVKLLPHTWAPSIQLHKARDSSRVTRLYSSLVDVLCLQNRTESGKWCAIDNRPTEGIVTEN